MAGVNKVILVGNLGKDPEVRHMESGVVMAKFPLATSESIRDKSGNRTEITEWHNVVLWRGLAEVAEKYLRKGHSVYIEGKIRTRSYDDKEGNKRYSTEIVADQMTMLGSRGRDNEQQNQQPAAAAQPGNWQNQSQQPSGPADPMEGLSGFDDDLPF